MTCLLAFFVTYCILQLILDTIKYLRGIGLSEFQHMFKGLHMLEGFAELDILLVSCDLSCFYYAV